MTTVSQEAREAEVTVREIETVTGDFLTEAGEPFYRIEINGYCADFDYREAAENFAAAINQMAARHRQSAERGEVVGYIIPEMLNRKIEFEANGMVMFDRPCGAATMPLYAAQRAESGNRIETLKLGQYALLKFEGPFHDREFPGYAVGKRTEAGFWLTAGWAGTTPYSDPVAWWPLPGDGA